MRGAALAQVELDRVRRPRAVLVSDDDEVDGEPAEHAEPGQPLGDRCGVLGDHPGVGGVGREDAAQVALPAGSAEQLVVRREQLDRAVRQRAELDARAAQLFAEQSLLDDAAAAFERSK